MNMIWTDIWHMDTVPVSTRPHFLVDKAPEPHDLHVVLRLNDFQPKVFTTVRAVEKVLVRRLHKGFGNTGPPNRYDSDLIRYI